MQKHKVQQEIVKKNDWYVGDQFKEQFLNSGIKHTINARWRTFEKKILNWVQKEGKQGLDLRVLDAGCGDGINLLGLKEIIDRNGLSATIQGCDYNPVRINRAQMGQQFRIDEVDLLNCPYPSEYFDVILCNHVIEHIEKDIEVLFELRRILKNDGLLIVGIPNEGCLMAQFRNKIVQRKILEHTDHVQFYTFTNFRNKIFQANLDIYDRPERLGFFLPHEILTRFLRASQRGRKIISGLCFLFPSQSAEFSIGLKKK